jgi:hypothetical protein
VSDDRRGEKFTQPDDSVTVTSGDSSTTPEALTYLTEHGAEAWARKYKTANTGGTVS